MVLSVVFNSIKDNRQEVNPASFFSPKSKTPKKVHEKNSDKSKPETKKRKASDNDDMPNKKSKTVNICG